MTDPNPTIPDPPPAAPSDGYEAIQVDVGELCSRLFQAVGLDPEAVQGFDLSVTGGMVPQLTVHPLPPINEIGFVDEWSEPLAQVIGSTSMAVLPGTGTTAPPVQLRAPVLPSDLVPAAVHPDHMACRVLLAMSDVLNGASCDDKMREWLSDTAVLLSGVFEARVYTAATAARQQQTETPS